MDIYCTKCGEPWDMETIHETVEERYGQYTKPWVIDGKHNQTEYEVYYRLVKDEFVSRGCVVFGGRSAKEWCDSHSKKPNETAKISAAMFDILGDDVDGVAAMMEDAEALGLFDDYPELLAEKDW